MKTQLFVTKSIVVTYNPDIEKLSLLMSALSSQTGEVVVVDNASKNKAEIRQLCQSDAFQYIELDKNYGIAYAQNQGIIYALDSKTDYVLLMDQDSYPEKSMVAHLLDNFTSDAIAVGPAHVDSRSGNQSFFLTNINGMPKRAYTKSSTQDQIEAAFLISSGTLIDLQKLSSVGGKRSNYFIDHVDTEWAIRSINCGYKLYGIPSATMFHSLGDAVEKVWFLGEREVAYHSPLRDYYMFRNTLLMLRDLKIKFIWRVFFIWRLAQFAGYFLIFAGEKRARVGKMSLGIWHGLRNIRGKLDPERNQCTAIPKTSLDP